MSRNNEDLVRRFLTEIATRRDSNAALACAHADINVDWSDSRAPYSGTYRGHEGVMQFWTGLWDAWDEFSPEIEEVIECGRDRLVTVTMIRARGKTSGIEVAARGAVLWTVRDGRISQVKLFQGKDEALEAVGVSEQNAHISS
jgi:ketosteroid isomerase-like protein